MVKLFCSVSSWSLFGLLVFSSDSWFFVLEQGQSFDVCVFLFSLLTSLLLLKSSSSFVFLLFSSFRTERLIGFPFAGCCSVDFCFVSSDFYFRLFVRIFDLVLIFLMFVAIFIIWAFFLFVRFKKAFWTFYCMVSVKWFCFYVFEKLFFLLVIAVLVNHFWFLIDVFFILNQI